MAEHAQISPSALDRIFRCPGSVKLSEGIEEKPSKYADEGSLAHEVAALVMETTGQPASDTLAEIAVGLYTFRYGVPDRKMLEHVSGYVDVLHETIGLDPDCSWEVEQKVHVTGEIWGTCDFWAWLPNFNMFVTKDLKYGAGKYVDVHGNKQQKAYLLGAFKKLMGTGLLDKPETVLFEMGIYQPRNLGTEGEAHRTSMLSYEDLQAFEGDLLALEGRVACGTEFADGECRWCKAAIRCPLNLDAANSLAVNSEAPKQDMSEQELADWMDRAPRFKRFLAAISAEAHARASLGLGIPGYLLEPSVGNRAYADVVAAEAALKPFGLAIYEKPVLKSPAQIEKTVPAAKNTLAGLVHRPDNGYILKRKPSETPE